MLFGFRFRRWFKKKELQTPIEISIKSIIWTTVRNRQCVYIREWGLGYTAADTIAQETYDRYLTECMKYTNMNQRIDRLQELLHVAEMRQVKIANLWKVEYGM